MTAAVSVEPDPQALSELRLENFRCIPAAEFEFDAKLNVLTGGNGAGKTSVLEAIHVLGRGRSFRAADHRMLIRSGADVAQVSGVAGGMACPGRLVVQLRSGPVEIRIGSRIGTPVELATALPVQTIHADIGGLIQGPPDPRRRLLDWGVFHVKHEFLELWRQFRRALMQRNAILRQGGQEEMLEMWEGELAASASKVDACRREYFAHLEPAFRRFGAALLGQPIALHYQRGWTQTEDLAGSLRAAREGDRSVGYTRLGPHRADLYFEIESERSRWRASKGQQKLLGAALILAQCELVASQAQRSVGLLVDEPAADLDAEHLGRFLHAVLGVDAQVFIAAITTTGLPLDRGGAMFHVEHGCAKALL